MDNSRPNSSSSATTAAAALLQDSWDAFRAAPDETNFRPLYEQTKALVYTICRRILRNPEDASDAFQSAYCRLLAEARNPSKDNISNDDIAPLIRRLAVREADSLRKRRQRRQQKEIAMERLPEGRSGSPSSPTPVDIASNHQLRDRVETLVALLPDRYRLPLTLHFYQGMSHAEIARALDIPIGTTASRIARGVKKLRPIMRRAGLGESAAALTAIAASVTLLSPPAALAAETVFAQAGATLAAAAAAAAGSGTAAAAIGSKLTLAHLGGAATGFAGLLFVGLWSAGVFAPSGSAPTPPPTENPETPEKEIILSKPVEFGSPGVTFTPAPDSENRPAEPPIPEPLPAELPPAYMTSAEPVWGIAFDMIPPGSHTYRLSVDGLLGPDPHNAPTDYSEMTDVSIFDYPKPASNRAENPYVLSSDKIQFIYVGPIERSLIFYADFRGGLWGNDEFRPLNEAAKQSQKAILENEEFTELIGYVTDETGAPVPAAQVRVEGLDAHGEVAYRRSIWTDNWGEFTFNRMSPGPMRLKARAPGCNESGYIVGEILSGDEAQAAHIVLETVK